MRRILNFGGMGFPGYMQDSILVAGRVGYYHLKGRAGLKAACERLGKSSVGNLYIEGEHFFGDDGKGRGDGSHPTDLGFVRQAEIFAGVPGPLLKSGK